MFPGPAVSVEEMVEAAREGAQLVGVSHRLTPETGERLLGQFAGVVLSCTNTVCAFAFGGTPPVVERARRIGFFECAFDGSEPPEAVLASLKGRPAQASSEAHFPQSAVERIQWKFPYPILRHHFGLPTLEETIEELERLRMLRHWTSFRLASTRTRRKIFIILNGRIRGAKVRVVCLSGRKSDYRTLYAASRRGNFPLLRTYSGTDDFIRLAEMYVETINNAWWRFRCSGSTRWMGAPPGTWRA